MESCARFLPLQLKVATYRLRSDFQCNLVGAAEDTFAVRESRATFMSTRQDCYSCLRGYSHETRRRNWLCSTESRNWVGRPWFAKGILFDFHRPKRDRSLRGSRFVSVDRLLRIFLVTLSDKTISDRLLDCFVNLNVAIVHFLRCKEKYPKWKFTNYRRPIGSKITTTCYYRSKSGETS